MNILNEIIRGVWLIQPETAKGYYPIVHRLLTGDLLALKDFERETPVSFARMEDDENTVIDSALDDTSQDIIMIMNISGAITKADQYCGPLGMASKAKMLKEADNLEQVKAHIIHIDSGGGEGIAARLMADTIKHLNKPTFAFVDGMAASAAYWIASACNFICASSPMDRVGSIGTYITIADYTNWFAQQGIRLIDVYAKKSSDKNRDYLDAISGNTERLQTLVDTFNEFFLQSVTENRSDQINQSAKWNTGEVFFARQAQEIGLIDSIASFEDYTREILKTLKDK